MSLQTVTKAFVSSMNYMDTRVIYPAIIDKTREDISLLGWMELMRFERQVTQPIYQTIYNSEWYANGIILSVTGAPGTNITIVLTTATANNAMNNSLIRFPSGYTAFVQSNTSGTLNVFSIDGSNITAADATAGNNVQFLSMAYGEGSDAAQPQAWSKGFLQNVVQIFKAKTLSTDIQLASTVETVAYGSDAFFALQVAESQMKFQKDVSLGLIIGPYSGNNFSATNPTLQDASQKPVNVTRGLDAYHTDYGWDYPLISESQFTLSDMQALHTLLTSKRSPRDFMWACSDPMIQKLDIFLNALNNSSQLSQAGRFMIEGEELKVGITKFNFFNRIHDKMSLGILDDPTTLGQSGMGNLSSAAFVMPEGMMETVGGGPIPLVGIAYMKIPQQNGDPTKYQILTSGGLAEPYTNETSTYGFRFETRLGLDANVPQFIGLVH